MLTFIEEAWQRQKNPISIHRCPQPLPRAELTAGIARLRGAETRHPGGADQDARPGARVAPAARGSPADVKAAKAVEANDAAFSHAGGDRRGQRCERATGFSQADLGVGGDFIAQRGERRPRASALLNARSRLSSPRRRSDGATVAGFIASGVTERSACNNIRS